jgi:tetratricopeptide (TPR) repeat protein
LISTLLAIAAAAQPVSAGDAARFQSCAALVKSQPENGIASANDWLVKGGGLLARQCLGLGYAAVQRWAPAATAFEQAAREAETRKDTRAPDLWVQAGNAWLAAGDGAKARTALDAALVTTLLSPELRGEVHLDRARAAVQLGDLAGARKDIDQGLKLVPDDPFGWYLSSALALRQDDLARARADSSKAVALVSDDGNVLLHAGNVAGITGDVEAARGFFEKAVKLNPASPAGKAAAAALAQNSGSAAPATAPPPAPKPQS